MAKENQESTQVKNSGADWFEAELTRGEEQAKTGETVNANALPSVHGKSQPGKKTAKAKRVNKGFQVEESRARAWDVLVAQMKSNKANKKTGPELIDEAIDYLLDKYGS